MSRLPPLIILVVLALMVGGGAAMLLLAPTTAYAIACTRTPPAQCTLTQGRRLEIGAHDRRSTVVALDSVDSASVRLVPGRRGSLRVLLYLEGRPQPRFAAEFEGSDAGDAAFAAARRLNGFFTQPGETAVRVDVSPPRLLGMLSWLGLIVAALLVVLAGVRISRAQSAGVEMDHDRMPTP